MLMTAALCTVYLDTLSILLNQQALPNIGNSGLDRTIHTDPAVNARTHTTAPEVLAKPGSATKRSDIFSLGAIFYELITGTPFAPDAAPASTIARCRPEVDAVLTTPFSPPFGPHTSILTGHHLKSKFLAAIHSKSRTMRFRGN